MTYEQLTEIFRVEQLIESAAEIHGNLCGRIAGGEEVRENDFKGLLIQAMGCEEELIDNVHGVMYELYREIYYQFRDGAFGLQLLLPSDETPLFDRVEALRDWCQGFVSGLGDAGIGIDREQNAELRDAVEDLVAISQVDIEADEGEDEEKYYVELTEYVRIAVMLLYSELGAPSQPPVLH